MILTERVNNYLTEKKISIKDFADAVHLSKRVVVGWLKCDIYLLDYAKERIDVFCERTVIKK